MPRRYEHMILQNNIIVHMAHVASTAEIVRM